MVYVIKNATIEVKPDGTMFLHHKCDECGWEESGETNWLQETNTWQSSSFWCPSCGCTRQAELGPGEQPA